MEPKVYCDCGPTSVGGVVMRLMTDGKTVWSEMWTASGWVKAVEVRDFLVNPAASPELLRALGVPESDWVWPERER